MELKLDPEAVQMIASKAIFEQLGEEGRNQVLEQAIQNLLRPEKKERWDTSPGSTPLQSAFNQAVSQAAFKAVQEKIAEDPRVKAGIDELLGPLINSALEEEAVNHNYSLSEALGRALGQWLADVARERRT